MRMQLKIELFLLRNIFKIVYIKSFGYDNSFLILKTNMRFIVTYYRNYIQFI